MINGIIFVSRGTRNLSNNSLILLPKAISKKKLLVDKLQKWTLSNLTNKNIPKQAEEEKEFESENEE